MDHFRSIAAFVVVVGILIGLIFAQIAISGDDNFKSQTDFTTEVGNGDEIFVGSGTATVEGFSDSFFTLLGNESNYQALSSVPDSQPGIFGPPPSFKLATSPLAGGWWRVVTETGGEAKIHVISQQAADFKIVTIDQFSKIYGSIWMWIGGIIAIVIAITLIPGSGRSGAKHRI